MLTSLRTRIFIITVFVSLLTSIMITFLVQNEVQMYIKVSQNEQGRNLVKSVYLNVENQYKSILFHEKAILERRKQELKNISGIVYSILDRHYKEFLEGKITESKAKKEVIKEIRGLRYAEGVGYFWINDTTRPIPKMIMHATIPELDGKILDDPKFNCALGKKENLFKAFVDVSLVHGEGYVDYLWPKPLSNGLTTEQPKISYVKLFKPWKWIVGTGLYVDDIEKDKQKRLQAVIEELKETSKKIRIRESGYMFIFDGDMKFLIHPHLAGTDGANLKDSQTGLSLLESMKNAVKNKKYEYEYKWDTPEEIGKYIYRKKAYLLYFEPLNWYIAYTVYSHEMEAPLIKIVRQIFILSGIILIIALIVALLLSRSTTEPLRKLTDSVREIEENGMTQVEIPVTGTYETKQLGKVINAMIHSIIQKTEELSDSEEKYRAIFEQNYPISLMEGNRFIDCNKSAYELLGYSSKYDFLNKHPSEISPERQPDGRLSFEKAEELINITIKNGSHHFEWVHKKADGEDIPVEIWLTYISVQGRKLINAIWHDISERKRSEEELSGLRLYLGNVINSMPSVLIGIDSNGMITQWNTEAENRTGIKAIDALGKLLVEEYPELNDEIDNILESINTKVIYRNLKKTIERGGIRYHEDITVYPLSYKGFDGAVIRLDDITEQVNTEGKLQQSQKMDAIGHLAGGIAHDFNNMLAGIMGNAELLGLELPVDSELRKYVETIVESGTRAAELTNKLLLFSRKGNTVKKPIDIHDSIISAIDLLFRSIDPRIKIEKRFNAVPSVISGDITMLQNVFLNLAVNARDAMPDGGTLTFSTGNVILDEGFCKAHTSTPIMPGKYIEIDISDTGTGIKKEVQSKIFEPFYTSKAVGKGTGLGLSAVYGTIRKHHGIIIVYSEVGIGTVFKIYIPENEDITGELDNNEEEIRYGSGCILVIDDEGIVRNTAEKLLSSLGYEVLIAKDGKEGLEIYRQEKDRIALVMLDLVMPKMGGKETFAELLKVNPDVKVLFASGFNPEGNSDDLFKMGALGFLNKPYQLTKLSQTIAEILSE